MSLAYKVIFWDFDGVLMNSNAVRDLGFEQVLSNYPKDQVAKLLTFHRANGGLSRYVKFRYFFEEVRGEHVTDTQIQSWADRFSVIMKNLLVNPELLIQDSLDFVKQHHQNMNMYIVSGSDQNELRYLCNALGLTLYFQAIHGSPVSKIELIKNILTEYKHNPEECVMIGDSINDYEAAIANSISFLAYNNSELEKDHKIFIPNV